jgi:2-phosphosulfolactate phosphatase
MKVVDVCLSPLLIDAYDLRGTVVVVADILRATSSITTALAHGVEAIRPVETLAECLELIEQGYIGAAERGGQKVDGFDLGNSPIDYMQDRLHGQRIAMTTTNGTMAIARTRDANQVIVGSFLNYGPVVNYLKNLPYDVLLVCAGWKGKVNMEDTLFAGAVLDGLHGVFEMDGDAARAALHLYRKARKDLFGFLQGASHVERLLHLGLENDIRFCLEFDKYPIVPVLKQDHLVKLGVKDMLF